jgi:CHASE3 domain sensor protein
MKNKEPFEKAEEALNKLEEEIKSSILKSQSLVVQGQNMAELLKWFVHEFEGVSPYTDLQCTKAKEYISRWEKEFPKKA